MPPSLAFTMDRYTSASIQALEMERVFRRTWMIAAHETDVARPGDCIPIDELDAALVLVRGDDRVVRAFRNSCRHRGTRLVARKCAGRRLTCPYHGWVYGLDGQLLGVPKRKGFGSLDMTSLGLHGVRTECWGGFVWITFDPDAKPVVEYLGGLAEQLAPYRLEDMRPLFRRTWTLPCNWKAVLDQATETYHVPSVHGRSIGRFVDSETETVARFHGLDPHHLQTLPVLEAWWRPWLDRASSPADISISPDQTRLLHKFTLFPNSILNVLPYYFTLYRVFPITADSCRLHYSFYIRKRPGAVGMVRGTLTLMASLYILREDLRLLPEFQAGVRAVRDLATASTFHAEERPLGYFHDVVDRYVRDDVDPS